METMELELEHATLLPERETLHRSGTRIRIEQWSLAAAFGPNANAEASNTAIVLNNSAVLLVLPV